MNDRIFLIGHDDELVDMQATPYDSEALLQGLLARYPALLPGTVSEEGRPPWLLVTREATIPDDTGAVRLSVDHLFLDREGVPTLVEVKRASDTRIRREVVGQMLDYAANAVMHWTVERIQSQLEVTCQLRQQDMVTVLRDFVGADVELDDFWQSVKTNLQAGRIRMFFVADRIPPELRRVVEFLNNQMDPAEVLAVEILQYEGAGRRTLVPRIVGQTEVAREKKASTGQAQQWDEQSFMHEMQRRHGEMEVRVAQQLLDWARTRELRVWWGKGKRYGSFLPVVERVGQAHTVIAVWTYGTVEVQFQHMISRPPFDQEDMRRQFLERLNTIAGLSLAENQIGRRPSFPLGALADGVNFQRCIDALDWFVDQVTATV